MPDVLCGRCSEPIEPGNRYKVRRGARGETVLERWCANCASDYTNQCPECSTRYSSHDDTYSENIIDIQYGGNRYRYCFFNECYVDNVWLCETDGAYTHVRHPYCRECNRDAQGRLQRCRCGAGTESSPIHNYSCEPNLVFHGDDDGDLFMGFELEMAIPNRLINEAAQFTLHALQDVEIAQAKSDSSIGGGFELVTQPHTYAKYRDSSVLWDTIETLRKKFKARSWDSGTCGLHIHVSRKAFADGRHTHRFIEFIYRNSDMMMKFGGRKSTYARFNDAWGFDEFDKPIFTLEGKGGSSLDGGEKYTAVNTRKPATLELRFFRGTTNTNGVKASLGLVHAMVHYTRELNEAMSEWYDWQAFVDYVNERDELYPELVERLPEVPEISLSEMESLKVEA